MIEINGEADARYTRLLERRIWIDGCFDFAHHGHAGAMLQARQHGDELYVGVHSDEAISENKGPVVMKLAERLEAVEGCRWCTKAISGAPYVTDPKVLDKYGCKYVVHGDDITTDANGEDCYKAMKDMGRFIVVKRTPNISTTDLVGRMLLYSKEHFLPKVTPVDYDRFFKGIVPENPLLRPDAVERYKSYATCEDGLNPGVGVFLYTEADEQLHEIVKPDRSNWLPTREIYYIDGGFDLFSPGHIVALKTLRKIADESNALVIAGVQDDSSVNSHKGLNYPIMNLFERSLCVLQSKYIDGIVIGAPYKPTVHFLRLFPMEVTKAFHGPTRELDDPYSEARELGIYQQLGEHAYDSMTTEDIVERVLENRKAYEQRQKRKGWKSERENVLRQQEKLPADQ
ncbi:DEKNAAC101268 [Brettanomyces naardenensis]|uniref:ethanolamine-phosphate cytidylyltransferase n=1 Tax=Brettanomyces naardenensis TaxID=13370 RepID=A0A448YHJ1_BRENA|nr:DEKNAAC101268 [Brettanomyces naardenensis]